MVFMMNLKVILLKEVRQTRDQYDSIHINSRKCKLIYSDRKQISYYLGVQGECKEA